MCILHQYNSVSNRSGATQHRYTEWSNRHIEAYLEDNHSPGNTESVGRDTEELKKKLTGKDENHYCDKRHNSGATDDRLTFFFCHPVSHSKEDGHCPQRVGQRKKRGEAK